MSTKTDTLGAVISEARARHGHSLKRAGDVMGVSDKMVKQWEQNFADPGWVRSAVIADYCGISRARVLWLMGVLTEGEAEHLDSIDGRTGGYGVSADLTVYPVSAAA